MANPYDAAARLAEGRPTVDDVEDYVAACRRLGYQHRDLTMRSTQIRDWYDGEDGLDLRAIDADHVALSAAASAAEDAARMQTDLASELSAAWSGRGAAAAHQFVWRSAQAATTVSTAVRTAADAMATLRDVLWRAVDTKVAATEAIDAGQQSQRADWLAAAKTVTTGAGDLAAASELVELQVKPFVDLEIGADWLAAMRAAIALINTAYDAAIAGTTGMPPAVFGVPGELGPRPEPARRTEAVVGREVSVPAPTLPAGGVGSVVPAGTFTAPPPASPPAAPQPLPATAPLPPASPLSAPPLAPAASSMPSIPSMGEGGAGTSSLGSGLSGFGQQLADLIGGLIGSADGGLPDPDVPDDLVDAKSDADVEDDPDAEAVTEPEGAVDEPVEPVAEPVTEPSPEPTSEPPPEPPPAEEPTPAPVPPPPDPPPPPRSLPEPVADVAGPTPCEIAADELPQVGE